jgi:hypothetical protein
LDGWGLSANSLTSEKLNSLILRNREEPHRFFYLMENLYGSTVDKYMIA